jgi:hypothetical protein
MITVKLVLMILALLILLLVAAGISAPRLNLLGLGLALWLLATMITV